MKKITFSFLCGLALASLTTAGYALKSVPDSSPDPQKPATTHTTLSASPTGGAVSELDFLLHSSQRSQTENWGPLDNSFKALKTPRAVTPSIKTLSSDIKVLGQVIYDEGKEYDSEKNDWLGFYNLPHSSSEKMTLAGYTNGPINRGGYADFDDKVYRGVYCQVLGSSIVYKYLVTFDLNTFETISAEEMPKDNFDLVGFGVAQNPVDGKVYGCYTLSDGSGVYWGTADYKAKTTQKIADLMLDQRLMGLTFTDEGVAYGLRETVYSSRKLELVKVDIATGAQEVVAPCTLPFRYAFGMCWNEKDKTILATYNTEDGNSGLMEIDPATGKATLVADFNADRQVVNLFIRPEKKELVPSKPELTMSAPEGSMTASYSLTLPETCVDGFHILGNVDWRLTLNGETLKEGSDAAGSTVTGEVTVSTTGYADFIAYAYNSEGRSENAKCRLFMGKGLAATPQNIVLAWDEATSTMSATWDAVTESADGGYINPAEVTYTVTDLEGKTIAENISATTCSQEMTAPEGRTEFAWSVTANYDNRQSAPGRSNSIFLGAMPAPFSYDFRVRKEFTDDGFTTIDNNNDGICFQPNGLGARCGHSDQKINMDDWLVTPGIYLEKGNSYLFTLTVHCYQNTDSEIVEVKCGTNPTVSSLTTNVISQTTIKSNRTAPSILTGVVTPNASGVWYIGMHAKSSANKGNTTFHVMIPEISLGAPMDPNCPNAPTNVKIIPATDGSLRAGVSYTGPTASMGGTSYAAGPTGPTMLKMHLYVGDETTPRQTVTVPGGYSGQFPQAVDFDACGDQTVYVVAETMAGYKSLATPASAYVGPYEPKQPANVRLTEVYQPGTVRIEWDPVTLDVNSEPLPAGHTTYMIYTRDSEGIYHPILDEPITETSYTFDALEDVTKQKFMRYFVGTYNWDFPSSRHGESNYTPIGVPYTLPVKFSGMDDLNNKACAFASQGFGVFGVAKENDNIKSQDGDGELYVVSAQYMNDAGMLRTGLISLVGAKNPELVLYTYKLADGDRNIVQASVFCNDTEEVIRFDRHDDMPEGEWTKLRYDLSKWRNKNIQVVITLGCLSVSYTYADNITIQDTPDYDLYLNNISAPAKVKTDKEFTVSASLTNVGYKETPATKASLYLNGEKVATADVPALAVDETTTVEFTSSIGLLAADNKAEYRIELEFDADANPADNVTETITVTRVKSSLAAPENLRGEALSDGNHISWDAIAAEGEGEITEDFESGEPWADYFGEWTFVDRDGSPLGGINEYEIPCVEHGVTTGSFFVFDSTPFSATTSNLTAHSGSKCLFSMYRRDDKSVDDFAISPLLDGKEQTISFYAKSLTGRYPEQLEVLYTFNDEFNYEDYVKVDGFGTKLVPEEWTEYTALIPAGAKHFAIRSRAAGGMMLLVDDVKFSPKAPELLGYNLYRDNKRLNSELLAKAEFVDKDNADSHTYQATAVYAEGESELSEPLVLAYSSVEALAADGISVYTRDGSIIINGAAGKQVVISSVDGKTLHAAAGDTIYRTPGAGLYLVTVGNATVKLIVR